MQMTPITLPAVAGELSRPAAAGRSSHANGDFAATMAATKNAPAKSAEAQGPKAVPPGLEKVQARLQEIAPEERSRGQTNALSAIERNIARYAAQQATATPAPETPTISISTSV